MTAAAIPTAESWDAIIIGGGPAGSTAATTLAKAGRRVLVLEKAEFPRFHIGESLLPYNRKIFDELGVWEKIATAEFTKKRAAQFVMGNGSHANRLDFSQGSFTEYPEAVQVERAKFDDILLHHSRENGAAVREESTVLAHRVEPERVVIHYRAADGSEHEVTAPYLIDASGLTNFTATRDQERDYYPEHKKLAIFSHFSGVEMPTGEQEGDIIIVRRAHSWCWLIPLAGGKTSVGLVIDAADFKALGKSPSKFSMKRWPPRPQSASVSPPPQYRSKNSMCSRISPTRTARSSRPASSGWATRPASSTRCFLAEYC